MNSELASREGRRKGKMIMGMFDGIEKASSTQGGEWIKPGQHRFRVNALRMPPKLRSGDCFIAELTVVRSTAHEEGASVSWVRNVTKHKEMALGDIKAFLAVLAGCEEESVTKEAAMQAVADNQPLAGREIDCEAFDRPTEAGGTFTRTVWSQAA